MTRKEELLSEAMRIAEMVGEQMGARLRTAFEEEDEGERQREEHVHECQWNL